MRHELAVLLSVSDDTLVETSAAQKTFSASFAGDRASQKIDCLTSHGLFGFSAALAGTSSSTDLSA